MWQFPTLLITKKVTPFFATNWSTTLALSTWMIVELIHEENFINQTLWY